MLKIAVDGPGGAGKSSISKAVAKSLGLLYIDTGAMFRGLGFVALNAGINILSEESKIRDLISKTSVSIKFVDDSQHIFVNDEDVTEFLRTSQVSIAASDISQNAFVRKHLLALQRGLADTHNVIMDGRDIGTVVLKDADVKIFLTASLECRAMRRFLELSQKGCTVSLDDVTADIAYRDENDSSRQCAPLSIADDAIVLDTTGNSFEQSCKLVEDIIKDRIGGRLNVL